MNTPRKPAARRWLARYLPALGVAIAAVVCWAYEVSYVVLLVVTALNLALREEFPFSHFPMTRCSPSAPFTSGSPTATTRPCASGRRRVS